MSVFSFTVPTWFMNEQPPGSRDQPTSSATNQPLAVFQSKCVHSAHFAPLWTESSCCSVVCPKREKERQYWNHTFPRVYLLRYSRAVLAYFASLSFAGTQKCEINYSCRPSTDSVLSLYQASQLPVRLSPNNCVIGGLLCYGIVCDLLTVLQTEQGSLVSKQDCKGWRESVGQ